MGTIKINNSLYAGSYLFDVEKDLFMEWLEKHLAERFEQPVQVIDVHQAFLGSNIMKVEATLDEPEVPTD